MSVVNCQSLFFPRIFWCTFYGKMCLSMAFSPTGAREKFPSIATRLLRTCQKKRGRKEKISDGAQSGLGVERGRGRYRLLEPEEGPGGERRNYVIKRVNQKGMILDSLDIFDTPFSKYICIKHSTSLSFE